jgi:hypothetical protein
VLDQIQAQKDQYGRSQVNAAKKSKLSLYQQTLLLAYMLGMVVVLLTA